MRYETGIQVMNHRLHTTGVTTLAGSAVIIGLHVVVIVVTLIVGM